MDGQIGHEGAELRTARSGDAETRRLPSQVVPTPEPGSAPTIRRWAGRGRRAWSVTVADHVVTCVLPDVTLTLRGADLDQIAVAVRLGRSRVEITRSETDRWRLRGVPRREARTLRDVLRDESTVQGLIPVLDAARRWTTQVDDRIIDGLTDGRWITEDTRTLKA